MNITLKAIKESAGATIGADGKVKSYKTGYQVSLRDMEVIKVRDLRKRHLQELLSQLGKGLCLGVWIDKGLVYIDQSKRISTKKEAIQLGKEYNQISIWNWHNSSAVYL